jgi:hypothetical protein
MKAVLLLRERIPFSEDAFAELVLWQLSRPLAGSAHSFKYRLAFVRRGVCVLRYDNESGKGDHRHIKSRETVYEFESPDKLVRDFLRDARRVHREDRDA